MSMSNRAYSLLHIKSVDDEKRIIRGIATTPAADLMDDVVESKGAQFSLPIPFLWQHDKDKPVGHVTKAKVTPAGIEVEVQLKETDQPGPVKDRLDAAWQDIRLGLVRGLSIGFKAVETARIEGSIGVRFLKWLWLELSAVTVAANTQASITLIKSLDHDLLAASGHRQSSVESTPAGASATKRNTVVKAQEAKRTMSKKSNAEIISDYEAEAFTKQKEADAILDTISENGETLTTEQKESHDELLGQVSEIHDTVRRLRARETANVAAAKPVEGKTLDAATESRGGGIPRVQVRKALPPGFGLVRLLSARYMAKEDGGSAAEIAASRGWGDDLVSVLRTPKHILKAPVGAATTTDSTWAGPLVTYQNLQDELIELMRPMSIINRIPGLRKVPFNTKVPRETGATTAYWVGQGAPKPVSAGALDTVTLDFAKVAGITFQTQELMRFSRPNSEQLMVNSLTKAITYLVDRDFLDPSKTAVAGESPASITSGSTSVAATGTTADAFRANFTSLLSAYSIANYSLDGLVFVMTQTQAMRLGMMRSDFGVKEFPDINKGGGSIEGFPVITSENIVATGGSPADGAIIVAMNANDILLADDGAVDVDISTEASIQADSAPDSPSTASTVMLSLWQRNMIGIRCERFITWEKARTDSVVYISGANYV